MWQDSHQSDHSRYSSTRYKVQTKHLGDAQLEISRSLAIEFSTFSLCRQL